MHTNKSYHILMLKNNPNNLLKSKGAKVWMVLYMNTDQANELVSRRYLLGISLVMNNKSIRWISTRKKTVENSTYNHVQEAITAKIMKFAKNQA
jgi:hypothetical protein